MGGMLDPGGGEGAPPGELENEIPSWPWPGPFMVMVMTRTRTPHGHGPDPDPSRSSGPIMVVARTWILASPGADLTYLGCIVEEDVLACQQQLHDIGVAGEGGTQQRVPPGLQGSKGVRGTLGQHSSTWGEGGSALARPLSVLPKVESRCVMAPLSAPHSLEGPLPPATLP